MEIVPYRPEHKQKHNQMASAPLIHSHIHRALETENESDMM